MAVAGAIAFIGLMGPYCKINYWATSSLLPISIIVGAFLLVLSDTIGKVILEPTGGCSYYRRTLFHLFNV